MSAPLISKGSEEEDEIFVHQDESPLQKMKGVRVLLIDDSEDAFLITRHLISKTSTIEVELEWAPDYETGLMRADDQRYHAYLVDYDLGASNGLELIQELKTRGITAPMILFTGKGSDELDVIAIRRGADDYLDKSEQTPALLGRTVRHAIQRSRDLETRVRLENRLRRLEKKKSIEVLAGGIAHNFNNILMIVSGHLDVIDQSLETAPDLKRSIDTIHSAIERASSLTKHLLAYSEYPQTVLAECDISQALLEMKSKLDSKIPPDVHFELSPAKGLPYCRADQSQLVNVVLQLLGNSVDAVFGSPGKIWIETIAVPASEIRPESLAFQSDLSAAQFVRLTVSDNGGGIEPSDLSRIFDPFYTTKSFGRGLGLSSALGIILSHLGSVQVESQPGMGTHFHVYFPAIAR